ncbi:hypothetical protein JW992_03550 [candidate division KSB1 bacterium]|nr:hypothetical protein [candidate division KSB1 bacterium]
MQQIFSSLERSGQWLLPIGLGQTKSVAGQCGEYGKSVGAIIVQGGETTTRLR